MKRIKTLLVIILLLTTASCAKTDLSKGTIDEITYEETDVVTNFVKIEMNDNSIMLLELYPDIAPITVANFQKLVEEKFYDEVDFHRVVKGFVIQAGISKSGKEGENIKGEFKNNGIDNDLSHKKGVISMARVPGMPDSASTQFFIVLDDTAIPSLDHEYAAFGQLIAGWKTLDKIGNVATNDEEPVKTQTIRSIRFIEVTEE